MFSSGRAYVSTDCTGFTSWSLKWDMAALQRLSAVCDSSRRAKLQKNHNNGDKPLFMPCLWRNKCQNAPNSVIFVLREQLLYLHFLLFFCSPGWESHLQKCRHDRGQSKVRGQMMELHSDNTVWNRMRDKRGGFFNALTVCCSHKTLAFCHYFSFTNCFYLLCIFWKCTVCIDVGGLFYFFHVELERMSWRQKKKLFCAL